MLIGINGCVNKDQWVCQKGSMGVSVESIGVLVETNGCVSKDQWVCQWNQYRCANVGRNKWVCQ